eukprot:TRINITY_DN4008_c1_g1_i2.p1 TRINITY_DN4008_c1_g1~~TRINITY_DN4008_c1_g1_i2.p1  ORF type:complete len:683 (+),score=167.21 TRINITY_DN4008_c1_g1_i2:69-2117(+)
MEDGDGGEKQHCVIRALTVCHSAIVCATALACVGGFGALIENQVNPNPVLVVKAAVAAPVEAADVNGTDGAAPAAATTFEEDVLAAKEKAFTVTTALSYVFLSVCAILAQVRVRRVLEWAHFLSSFPGRAALQLFIGVEVLNMIEQLAALGADNSTVRDAVTGVGWTMVSCGLVTFIWYGLVLPPPPPQQQRFRGTKAARALALLLLLLLSVAIPFLALTEGWADRVPACLCAAEWEHQGRTYVGCATTLDRPSEPWCYTAGTTCDLAKLGRRDAAEGGEVNKSVAWRDCTDSVGTGECKCAADWSVSGVCGSRKGCSSVPCGNVSSSVWCVAAAECKASPKGGYVKCTPDAPATAAPTTHPPSRHPTSPTGAPYPGMICVDTPGWESANPKGIGCAVYAGQHCQDGGLKPGHEVFGDPGKDCAGVPCDEFRGYPTVNCCGCGKGVGPRTRPPSTEDEWSPQDDDSVLSPTLAPTRQPATSAPTASPAGPDSPPTRAPLPDGAPTHSPVVPPTAAPSSQPVPPTAAPTGPPAPAPTSAPAPVTAAPTKSPATEQPTSSPVNSTDSAGPDVVVMAVPAAVLGACLCGCVGAVVYSRRRAAARRVGRKKLSEVGIDSRYCNDDEPDLPNIEDWEETELNGLVNELSYQAAPCPQSLRSVGMKGDFTLAERLSTAVQSVRRSMFS